MQKSIITSLCLILGMLTFQACDSGGGNSANSETATESSGGGGTAEMENTDMVPSGTYTVTASQVDPEEKEIYVQTQDNKTLELYFTEQTTLTQDGDTVSFDALKQGQQLEITVEKKGQRLEPLEVNIVR